MMFRYWIDRTSKTPGSRPETIAHPIDREEAEAMVAQLRAEDTEGLYIYEIASLHRLIPRQRVAEDY